SALPLVLGLRQPERSLADARHLERVAAELGASPAGLGYVDLPLLARAHGAALPDPCGAELAGLAALVPRISIGLRRATAGRLHVVSAAETRRDVTDALLALRGTVPAADPDVPVPASAVLGLAIDAAAAIRVVGGALDQVVESPYRCPALGWLNRGARDLRALLRTGALGLLRQVRGVSLLILPGEPGAGGAPARPVEGALLFLGSDDPRALLAQLSALTHIPVPKLAPGDPPAEIAAGAAMPLGPVHVALGARSLGVSLGGHQTELGELIAAAPPADPPLVFLRTIPRDSGSLLELVTGRAGRSDPALAGEDPEIARLVAAARDRPLARYEEVTTTARASSRGLEIQLTARYPR
ncbi:MAG TPA: hypothetical protein VKZ63_03555, partial [Kofleriaceae bacterium]|nr:hypothetical protein [Kofleriaceae bacterium]